MEGTGGPQRGWDIRSVCQKTPLTTAGSKLEATRQEKRLRQGPRRERKGPGSGPGCEDRMKQVQEVLKWQRAGPG